MLVILTNDAGQKGDSLNQFRHRDGIDHSFSSNPDAAGSSSMRDSPDATVVTIRCPWCGKQHRDHLNALRGASTTRCPLCGATIPLDQEDLARVVAQAEVVMRQSPGVTRRGFWHPLWSRRIAGLEAGPMMLTIAAGIGAPLVVLNLQWLLELPYAWTPACAVIPQSGAIVETGEAGLGYGGPHSIEIKNGGDNAIVALRDVGTNSLVVKRFLAANDTVAFQGLRDGRYRIQFATGIRLAADCRSFIRRAGASEFNLPDDLRTEWMGDGYVYHQVSLTLFPVPGGNATSHPISQAAFDAP